MCAYQNRVEELDAIKSIYDERCIWLCPNTQQRLEMILDIQKGDFDLLQEEGQNEQLQSYSPWDKLIHDNIEFPKLLIRFDFHFEYPYNDEAPLIKLVAPWIDTQILRSIIEQSRDIYIPNQYCLFDIIEEIRNIATKIQFSPPISPQESESTNCIYSDNDEEFSNETKLFNSIIYPGETIVDRKSVFQGFSAKVNSVEEVFHIHSTLLSNPRIARATHNILAYSITNLNNELNGDNSSLLTKKTNKISTSYELKDHDSDGETAAGGRLQFLLSTLSITNVMVMVSRWYGGKKLGPDRFKHINNAARDALEKGGFIKSNKK